ncbi:STAS domain-containing protein [Undibacterium jejuense]|uniref:STAS domain-containing protein n=1 Tax=Undibacterium jejuense TaxID=1344949 RepID=A0A923HGY7_9BURK|nr:STAS domain-containing protein [Undibacterium jejuense]MBC3863544.1 STAS domain-containing protein [Undibacterium jejuense]
MISQSIEGELTIYTAAIEKQRLINFLDSEVGPDRELELNLSQVSEMDTAGLQVLILMKNEARRRGKVLHYVMHSKAVLDILEISNMTAHFGDQVVLT